MKIRKKAIAVVASAGFLALTAGAGMPATTGPGAHEVHHPQAAEGQGPAGGGCANATPAS